MQLSALQVLNCFFPIDDELENYFQIATPDYVMDRCEKILFMYQAQIDKHGE